MKVEEIKSIIRSNIRDRAQWNVNTICFTQQRVVIVYLEDMSAFLHFQELRWQISSIHLPVCICSAVPLEKPLPNCRTVSPRAAVTAVC